MVIRYSPTPEVTHKSGEDTYSSAILEAHRYTEWVLSPFKPFLRGNILEVGIGHGGYYEILRRFGAYWGVDIDNRSIDAARESYPDGNFAVVDICQERFIEQVLTPGVDAIVSINVLEHIEDDGAAIRNLIASLKPGGHLLLNVPAHPALYNDLDRLAGHFRRYRLNDIRRLMRGQPVCIELLQYFNPIGGVGWWVNRFFSHESLNSSSVNNQIALFEKVVLPLSRALDPLTRRFFGQSLVCVARRL